MSSRTEFFEIGENSMEVHYDYTPEEKVLPYLQNGDPGCPGNPEQIEINLILLDGVDVTDFVYHFSIEEKIEEMIRKKYEEYDPY